MVPFPIPVSFLACTVFLLEWKAQRFVITKSVHRPITMSTIVTSMDDRLNHLERYWTPANSDNDNP